MQKLSQVTGNVFLLFRTILKLSISSVGLRKENLPKGKFNLFGKHKSQHSNQDAAT